MVNGPYVGGVSRCTVHLYAIITSFVAPAVRISLFCFLCCSPFCPYASVIGVLIRSFLLRSFSHFLSSLFRCLPPLRSLISLQRTRSTAHFLCLLPLRTSVLYLPSLDSLKGMSDEQKLKWRMSHCKDVKGDNSTYHIISSYLISSRFFSSSHLLFCLVSYSHFVSFVSCFISLSHLFCYLSVLNISSPLFFFSSYLFCFISTSLLSSNPVCFHLVLSHLICCFSSAVIFCFASHLVSCLASSHFVLFSLFSVLFCLFFFFFCV